METEQDPGSRLPWKQAGGWAVAASGLPGLYGTWLRDFAVQHPLRATLILVLYWIVLAAVGFVWHAIGDAVGLWRQEHADRLGIIAGRLLLRHERIYRAEVRTRLREIGSSGLTEMESSRPVFDEVYVDVDLARSSPKNVPSDALATVPVLRTGRLRISTLLAVDEARILVALGAAGIGKTTLSHHIARELAARRLDRRFPLTVNRKPPFLRRTHRRSVPILVTLPVDLPKIIGESAVSLAEFATTGMQQEGGCRKWLDAQLENGRCVVVVDGLDEVSESRHRDEIATWVEQSPYRARQNHFVVTSRPDSYKSAFLKAAPLVVQVSKLTEAQIQNFVRKRFAAMEGHLGHAERLLKQLRNPALFALTVNPLLLTMTITLYSHLLEKDAEPRLPDKRVELYSQICRVLLQRRPSPGVNEAQKLGAIKKLAYAMMTRGTPSIDRADATAALGLADAEYGLISLKIDGLLVVPEYGDIRFTHKTFQEYLAAVHIHANDLAETLVTQVAENNGWWREAIIFFAGLGPYRGAPAADPIIEACLSEPYSPSAIALALSCREQGATISADLLQRLDELVVKAVEPSTAHDIRRVVARALLTHHLDRNVAQPITARIYKMFVIDSREDGYNCVPDAPYPDDDDAPVRGVAARDAARFARWANAVLESSIYRLPTRREADDLADGNLVGVTDSRIWLDARGTVPQRWTREGATTRVEQRDELTVRDIVEDFIADPRPHVADESVGSLPPIVKHPALFITAEVNAGLAIRVGTEIEGITFSGQPLLHDDRAVISIAAAVDPDLFRSIGLGTQGGVRILNGILAEARNETADAHSVTRNFGMLASSRSRAIAGSVNRVFNIDGSRSLPQLGGSPIARSVELTSERAISLDPPSGIHNRSSRTPAHQGDIILATALGRAPDLDMIDRCRVVALGRFLAAAALDGENIINTLSRGSIANLTEVRNLAERHFQDSTWALGAIDELVDAAGPVLRRDREPNRELTRRVCAIAVLVAPKANRDRTLFWRICQIAIDTVHLQRRFSEQPPPNEVILLFADE